MWRLWITNTGTSVKILVISPDQSRLHHLSWRNTSSRASPSLSTIKGSSWIIWYSGFALTTPTISRFSSSTQRVFPVFSPDQQDLYNPMMAGGCCGTSMQGWKEVAGNLVSWLPGCCNLLSLPPKSKLLLLSVSDETSLFFRQHLPQAGTREVSSFNWGQPYYNMLLFMNNSGYLRPWISELWAVAASYIKTPPNKWRKYSFRTTFPISQIQQDHNSVLKCWEKSPILGYSCSLGSDNTKIVIGTGSCRHLAFRPRTKQFISRKFLFVLLAASPR